MSKEIIEVDGGFIAKEYTDGSVTAQSAVFPTKEEADAAELTALVKKDAGIGQATPEAMVDPELKARTDAARVVEDAPVAEETPEVEAPAPEEVVETVQDTAPEVDPEGDTKDISEDAPAEGAAEEVVEEEAKG